MEYRIDEKYDDDGNWKTASYNRGVHAGADQVVAKYEKQCLEDTVDYVDDHFKDDDKWHGSGDDGYEYIVNTEMPTEAPYTKKPSRHPTSQPTHKWGGGWKGDDWYGSGDDDFAGIIRTELPTYDPTPIPTAR
jgi:hypothetical protein